MALENLIMSTSHVKPRVEKNVRLSVCWNKVKKDNGKYIRGRQMLLIKNVSEYIRKFSIQLGRKTIFQRELVLNCKKW